MNAHAETLGSPGELPTDHPAGLLPADCHMPPPEEKGPDDVPGECRVRGGAPTEQDTFARTVAGWDSIQDLNDWIGANFEYDKPRMGLFGQNVPAKERPPVYTPDEVLAKKKAVCFDLSRFAYEALKNMPMTPPVQGLKYVMIQFKPENINGAIIGKHWMISYQKDGKFYFTADSRCPGRVYGPYDSVEKFQQCYARFRDRTIQSISLRDTYRRLTATKKAKTQKG